MKESTSVRKATPEDSLRVWEIRNAPESRHESLNQAWLPWENHQPWFQKKYFGNDTNTCFVLDYDKKVIGYCRFDADENGFRVSIALDPDYHGKGLGNLLLMVACSQFGKDKNLVAEIKKTNIASVKIFKNNGFIIVDSDDEEFHLQRRAE